MAKAAKRAALYVRVSTDHQTVENQVVELRQVAERRGWQVAEVYKDAGISGAKGRDQRPGCRWDAGCQNISSDSATSVARALLFNLVDGQPVAGFACRW